MTLINQWTDRIARGQLALAAVAICSILFAISLDLILRTTLTRTMEVVSFYCMVPVAFLTIMLLELRGEQ